MRLPQTVKELTKVALKIVEACTEGQGKRASAYRQFGQWIETGRPAGGLALANMLYGHVDRTASHLFSPTDLRFAIDYENIYPQEWMDKGTVAARVVSREWERKNIDVLFGHGVKEALSYGSYLLKQLAGKDAEGHFYFRGARLVPPWAFGVYDEGVNELDQQEALTETVWLNRHEVWRRVRNLPDAEKLYKRILSAGAKEDRDGVPRTFMHQILSTAMTDLELEVTGKGIVNDSTYRQNPLVRFLERLVVF